jgi:hypothetical protein
MSGIPSLDLWAGSGALLSHRAGLACRPFSRHTGAADGIAAPKRFIFEARFRR